MKNTKKEEYLIGFDYWKAQLVKTTGYNELNPADCMAFLQGAKQSYDMLMAWHNEQADYLRVQISAERDRGREYRDDLETLASIIKKHMVQE